jgi:hypothetical protein
MTLVGDWVTRSMNFRLFRRPAEPLTPWQVIGWWELRRLAYNLIVGATGLFSVATAVTVSVICDKLIGEPIGMPDPAIFAIVGIVVYGIMANVCFTGGWVVELFLAQVWAVRPSRFGQIAFSLGLLGSVFLTLLPAGYIVISAAVTLVLHAAGVPTNSALPHD